MGSKKGSAIGNETKAATREAQMKGPSGSLGEATAYLKREIPKAPRSDLPKPRGGKGPAHG